jgi:type IV secretory pathway ATPase VirB11/archaellum biosynthesis ATPase
MMSGNSTNKLIDAIPEKYRKQTPKKEEAVPQPHVQVQTRRVSPNGKKLLDAIPMNMRRDPSINFVTEEAGVESALLGEFSHPGYEAIMLSRIYEKFGSRIQRELGVLGGHQKVSNE